MKMIFDPLKFLSQRLPSLNKDEEMQLAHRANSGDSDALELLVKSHLTFLINIAKRYSRSGIPIGDLLQEGVIGFMHAIKKFDPGLNTRLSTYARFWVRASMQDYVLKSWSIVKFGSSSSQKSLFLNLRRKASEVIYGGDVASDQIVSQLAKRFKTTSTEVRSLANRIVFGDQTLETSGNNQSTKSLSDYFINGCVTPEEKVVLDNEKAKICEVIGRALKKLPAREQFIIRHRYLEGAKQTFSSIGKELGLSKDRVRQLEFRALKTLRKLTETSLIDAQIIIK